MSDKFTSAQGFQFSQDQLDALRNFQPTHTINLANEANRQMEESMRAMEKTRREKEREELRRHEELVGAVHEINQTMKDTVLEAIKMGATVNIDSNSGNVNISMNSTNVEQNAVQDEGVDFDAVQSMITNVEKYCAMPGLLEELGDDANQIKNILAEINEGIKKKDAGLIKKAIRKLKELASGIEGSLIATGIVEGIKKIGTFL